MTELRWLARLSGGHSDCFEDLPVQRVNVVLSRGVLALEAELACVRRSWSKLSLNVGRPGEPRLAPPSRSSHLEAPSPSVARLRTPTAPSRTCSGQVTAHDTVSSAGRTTRQAPPDSALSSIRVSTVASSSA